jgi:putative aminopeptidase FrvX
MVELQYETLERLLAVRGPPNAEYRVAELFEQLIEPHVDAIEWDDMGNVIATSEGTSGADSPEIMLAAHTDELGLLIDGVRTDGFLEYTMLGGHYKGNFPGQRVVVGPNNVPGVIGPKSRHLMTDEEHESLPDELYIDVGSDSPEEVAELDIKPGDYASWAYELTRLGGDYVTSRALDDRIALAVLVAVAQATDVDATVHYVATVQEELGLRGARAVGFAVDPDIALAVEIFPADDYPAAGNDDTIRLGDGPVIEFGDGTSEYMFDGVLIGQQTLAWLKRASEQVGISHQNAVMIRGTTDATEFQQVRGGRHAGAIAIPCRYTHSPVETVSMADANQTAAVLATALETPFPTREEVRHR